MKKTLVVTLALVFVLGIAGTAFAANPFVDVPSKHWSYDAVNQLTKAGIVDGYGDGTFRGDKTMTRYEMAQIVAKALAKADRADASNKALIDKLAVEYNAELQNLGVRVSKLEASQSQFKVTGDYRMRYNNKHCGDEINPAKRDAYTADGKHRLRLYMSAPINDNVQFNGKYMVIRHGNFGTVNADDNQIAEASATVKDFFGTKLIVGRQSVDLGATGYFISTWGMVDGVQMQFGNQAKVTVGYGDFTNATLANPADAAKDKLTGYGILRDAYFTNVKLTTSKATSVTGMYIKEVAGGNNDYDVFGIGFNSKLSKDWGIAADYYKNTGFKGTKYAINNDDPVGYVARVFYKGHKKSVPHSWGLTAEYDKWEKGSYVIWSDYANATLLPNDGNEFFAITGNYMLDKNVMFSAYQTINHKDANTGEGKDHLTRLQLDFYF